MNFFICQRKCQLLYQHVTQHKISLKHKLEYMLSRSSPFWVYCAHYLSQSKTIKLIWNLKQLEKFKVDLCKIAEKNKIKEDKKGIKNKNESMEFSIIFIPSTGFSDFHKINTKLSKQFIHKIHTFSIHFYCCCCYCALLCSPFRHFWIISFFLWTHFLSYLLIIFFLSYSF